MLKITVLTDDSPHPDNPRLRAERGLSLYIELNGCRILCDTGASDRFVENAAAMGIPLRIDLGFISHGHADHTGGLGHFLRFFPSAPVYLSRHVFDRRLYSSGRGPKRYIGTDATLPQRYGDRFVYIDECRWIAPDVAAVRNFCSAYPKPFGNYSLTAKLDGREEPDTFDHELALALRTEKGLVVVSPCSHGGAVNLIRSCCWFTGGERVYAFVGGLHFTDREDAATEAVWFREDMNILYPNTRIHTGHCTGERARQILSDGRLDVRFFHTGSVIEL